MFVLELGEAVGYFRPDIVTTVAYTCPFVPAEWITAHGLEPRPIRPRPGHGCRQMASGLGICPFAQAFIAEAASGEHGAVVFTTTCDQMRRAAEAAELTARCPIFLMNIPATWQTATARRMFRDEVARLGRFLTALGGRSPSSEDLAAAMLDSKVRREGSCRVSAARPDGGDGVQPVRVALVGSHRMAASVELEDVVASAGGQIVLEATPSGELGLGPHFEREQLGADPFGTLVNAYFDTIPDVFRRPNTRLYEWLALRLAERQVRGIIFRHYLWCDLWHAEAQRLKEWSPLPVLVLEAGDEDGVSTQNASRIQAFMEILHGNSFPHPA